MIWREEYDAICQPGYLNREPGDFTSIALPDWLVHALAEKRYEDIAARPVITILKQACTTALEENE